MPRDRTDVETSEFQGAHVMPGSFRPSAATVTVLGKMDSKWLVRSEYTPGKAHVIAQRTLDALIELGIPVADDKNEYIL